MLNLCMHPWVHHSLLLGCPALQDITLAKDLPTVSALFAMQPRKAALVADITYVEVHRDSCRVHLAFELDMSLAATVCY